MKGGAVETVVTFLVGGGLVTLITQFSRVYGSLRRGARASNRAIIRDLAADRDEAEDREAEQRAEADFWRSITAGYAYQLRKAGIRPDPDNPVGPADQRRMRLHDGVRSDPSARRLHADHALTTDQVERVLAEDDEDRDSQQGTRP